METESDASQPDDLRRSGSRNHVRGRASVIVELGLVGVGGAAGAFARYSLGEALPESSEVVTLGINVSGAFLIGLLVSALAGHHPRIQLLFGTGLLGGFTTYSLLALQTSGLLLGGDYVLALMYGTGTVVLGFAAVLAGVGCGAVARRVLRQRQ